MSRTKRILLLGFILMAFTIPASADLCVVVEQTDNTRIEFLLSDEPQISYNGVVVTIATSRTSVELPTAQVKKVYVAEASVTGISQKETYSIVRIDITSTDINLNGLEAGSIVYAYTIDGRIINSGRANNDGTLQLSIGAIQNEIIVVKTSKQTFKLIRK